MARSTVHTFTKLLDEPFFIRCRDGLRDPDTGVQVATITSIDTQRLERRIGATDTYEVAVAADGFANLQILDDGDFGASMIAGTLSADRDTDPAPGLGYVLVIECTITFTAEFGGGTAGRVFRRDARIDPTAVTAAPS